MRNVEAVAHKIPFFRVPAAGMPPLRGWAVQYVSGMEPETEIKQGFWLSQWHVNAARDSAEFNFESELVMCYDDQKTAVDISDALRKVAEIETKVVKV